MLRKSLFISLALMFVLLAGVSPPSAHAATLTAVTTDSGWNTASTWDCNCVPTGVEDLVIPAGIMVHLGGYQNSGTIDNAGTIEISAIFTNSGTVTNTGILAVNGAAILANYGTITSPGMIVNDATIRNYGSITGSGTFWNVHSTVVNVCMGTLTWTGTFQGNPVGSWPCAPVVSFSYSAVDLTVTFTDTSTNSPNWWYWWFGDGASDMTQNPVHTYAADGTYNVCLRARNDSGMNDPTCIDITISVGTSCSGDATPPAPSPTPAPGTEPDKPSHDEKPPDDRLNWRGGDHFAVLYARHDSHGGPAIHVYCINAESHGTLSMAVTGDDLAGFASHPAHNTLVKEGMLCHARFYILTTGEYQINVGPDWEGKEHAFIFNDLSGSGFHWHEFR